MVDYIDLKPTFSSAFAEDLGRSFPGTTSGAPPSFDPYSGYVNDDSDQTFYSLGAYQDVDSNVHIRAMQGLFKMPAGDTPVALLLKIRARSSSDVLGTSPAGTRLLYQTLADDATSTVIDARSVGNYSGDYPIRPLTTAIQTDPAWMQWFYDGPFADPNNPTDAGNWLTMASAPAAADALTKSGTALRVTIGMWWAGPADVYKNWFDLFEFRLRVAYTTTAVPYVPPLRQYPTRGDGLGADSHRTLYPPPQTLQSGQGGIRGGFL